jgi:hypothetical protein
MFDAFTGEEYEFGSPLMKVTLRIWLWVHQDVAFLW